MAQDLKVNTLDKFKDDLTLYAIYIAKHRSVPDFRDGLKDVQRKILYSMYADFPQNSNRTFKSAGVVGEVMKSYHPHGDSAIYQSIKPMVNWFECNVPLIRKQGNFGNFQGDGPAAARYTEVALADFAREALLDELDGVNGSPNIVDWSPTFDNSKVEPDFLPAKVPLLLINGIFGIAVGFRPEVPPHNLCEVIDATIKLLDNPNAQVVLVPDHNMPCDIIEADFKKISNNGFGAYRARGHIDIGTYDKKPALFIHSVPNSVYLGTITDSIDTLVSEGKLPQIINSLENHTPTKLEHILVLKPGSDPNFVRDTLYANTSLECSYRVNFQVQFNGNIHKLTYKQYLQEFLQFRKITKLRLYYNLLQRAKTKFHEREAYITLLKSGEIDKIINMIKKRKDREDQPIIDYLVTKFKITPLQAKTIINTQIKNLSMGNLNRYIDEAKELKAKMDECLHKIHSEEALNEEIRNELLYFKKKYGVPRRCRVISKDDINNIPEGKFNIVVSESNKIKKYGVNEPLNLNRGEPCSAFILNADNRDNLLMFDSFGRVFSMPVHKIPLTGKGQNGTDALSLNKKMTSIITNIISESKVKELAKSKAYTMVVLTQAGYIKRLELDDFCTVASGGLIYSKLENGDKVQSILITQNGDNQIITYSDKKALRFKADDIPVLKRATRGVKAMNTNDHVDGMSVVYGGCTNAIVVTHNGYINKIDISALPMSSRARAGNNVIKLGRGDAIKDILIVRDTDVVMIESATGKEDVAVRDIPLGSSISKGNRVPNLIRVVKRI